MNAAHCAFLKSLGYMATLFGESRAFEDSF